MDDEHSAGALARLRVRKLEQALGQIRAYAEAWADPDAGDAIPAILDRVTSQKASSTPTPPDRSWIEFEDGLGRPFQPPF